MAEATSCGESPNMTSREETGSGGADDGSPDLSTVAADADTAAGGRGSDAADWAEGEEGEPRLGTEYRRTRRPRVCRSRRRTCRENIFPVHKVQKIYSVYSIIRLGSKVWLGAWFRKPTLTVR